MLNLLVALLGLSSSISTALVILVYLIIAYLFVHFLLVIPIVSIVENIIELFKRTKNEENIENKKTFDGYTVILAITFFIFLVDRLNVVPKQIQKSIFIGQNPQIFFLLYVTTLIIWLGGYLCLKNTSSNRLSAIAIFTLYISGFLSIKWLFQLVGLDFLNLGLVLFPINYMLLSFILIKKKLLDWRDKQLKLVVDTTITTNDSFSILKKVLISTNKWPTCLFIFMMPILGLLLALVQLIEPKIMFKKSDEQIKMNELTNELKEEEIFNAINFIVNSGYYSDNDIIDQLFEILDELFKNYDLPSPDIKFTKKLMTDIKKKQDFASSKNNYLELQAVFDQLNQEGIIAIDNAGFDISEGHDEVGIVFEFMKEHDISRVGYCFFHHQDIDRSLDPSIEQLFLAFHSLDAEEDSDLAVGRRIVELLKARGFIVSWDGTINQRICLENFLWDKTFSDDDNGVERAIRVIKMNNS